MKGIGKRVKDGPIRKADSTEIPRRKYYRPAADAKTYRMNGQGQLQCQQDPKDVTRVGSVKELPLCREKPIFHEPVGTLIKDKEQLTAMYPNSFDRIGSLKGEYTIKIDPSITPVQQARHKVPIESREAISAALDSMIAGDILEPQIEPTPWVNSATYPVKPTGEVRPCLDCMPLNKAIIRENHTPPTVEEIAHELAEARYFTKVDAHKAFLHVHLSKKSRELTVFGTNTHGRLRCKRMPFGMKMSQDMFQIQMDRILEQCPSVIGIHDDVIIYRYTQEDHDANLINFLNVCQMEGLCLSSKKLELCRDRVSFFGAIYSREGVEPDPKKIQGIEEMTAPETKQQLQSFLGMVTYMGNFIPHLIHHTELLRQLLKKDVTFYWDDQLTRSFQEIKHLLMKATSKPLGYYNQRKEVIVQADASLRRLGACLIQDGKPIAFASKSLTGAESRYANIERELLAVVFACIWFNTYLQGRKFTVQSDHKPLEMIHLKSMHNAPPRLQRMLLQLQKQDTAVDFVSDAPCERAITFNDNPVAGTRYIPLMLRDTPQEPRPLSAELPFDPMTPAADAIQGPETAEQREKDHDNVPDTGPSTDSSAADTSGTSESSPGSSSTTGTDEMTDTASNETSGSSSSSNDSTESDSAPSAPSSPRQTSMPCTEEAMSAKVPSGPPSPSLADSSLEVRQILRDQARHALTRSQYQKQTNAAKQRATVLKRVAQLDINQLPLPKPGEPQPGPSGESNGASCCLPSK